MKLLTYVDLEIVPLIVLVIMIVIVSYTDFRYMRIPNHISFSAAILGITLHLIINGWDGFIFAFVGLLSGFIPMLALYLCKAVGAGDVKLFAAIGALTGFYFVVHLIFYSIVFAGVIAIIILLARQEFVQRILNLFTSLLLLMRFRDRTQWAYTFNNKLFIRFPFMIAVTPAVLFILIGYGNVNVGEEIFIAWN